MFLKSGFCTDTSLDAESNGMSLFSGPESAGNLFPRGGPTQLQFWAGTWEAAFLQGLQVVLMESEAEHHSMVLNLGYILIYLGKL